VNLGTFIAHLPMWFRPLWMAMVLMVWVTPVNVGWIVAIRQVVRELMRTPRFTALVVKTNSGGAALRGMLVQRPSGQRWRSFVALRLLALTAYVAATWVAAWWAMAPLLIRPDRYAASAMTQFQLLHWALFAGYVIVPPFLVATAIDDVVERRTRLLESPAGTSGRRVSRWSAKASADIMPLDSDPPARTPAAVKATTAQVVPAGQVQWPDAVVPRPAARAAALRAYVPHAPYMMANFLAVWGPAFAFAYVYSGLRHDPAIRVAGILAVAVPIAFGGRIARHFIRLPVRAQVSLLWCLQYQPTAAFGGLHDPLGPLRAGLVHSHRLLLRTARNIELRAVSLGVLQPVVVLRAVAAQIDTFLSSRRAFAGKLPDDLRRTLELTVAYIAGPADPTALALLSKRVRAFDGEHGAISEDLAGTSRSPGRRLAARLATGITTTWTLTRAAVALLLLLTAVALMIAGHGKPENLPNWVK